MKVKTQDLIGPALAYAVCLADGWEPGTADMAPYLFTSRRIKPDADWSQGGPIIEREGMAIGKSWVGWKAFTDSDKGEGPTPLIAAMRCFVASKLGEQVEIPNELMEV